MATSPIHTQREYDTLSWKLSQVPMPTTAAVHHSPNYAAGTGSISEGVAHCPPTQSCQHGVEQVLQQDVSDVFCPPASSFKCNEAHLHEKHQEPERHMAHMNTS